MYKEITVRDLAGIVRARNGAIGRELVRGVSIDTRTLRPGDAFFALPGERTDGHRYVDIAVRRGAVAVVVQRPSGVPAELVVRDTRYALGELGRHYRGRFAPIVIGITGTSGKTTVKRILHRLLAVRYRVGSAAGNFNSLLGVPLSIFAWTGDEEVGILELGTSGPGEIARLCAIARPRIGVITMIGPGHLQGLGSIAGVRAEKLALLQALPASGFSVTGDGAGPADRPNRIVFSMNDAQEVFLDEHGSRFRFREQAFATRLLGPASVYNCLAALTVALELGVPGPAAAEALAAVAPEPGRFEPIRRRGWLVLNDAYNANPLSMNSALEFTARLRRRRVFVLGDMRELGPESAAFHRAVGETARRCGGTILTMGDEARHYGGRHFTDRGQLVGRLLDDLQGDEAILVKASHALGFDRIVDDLLRRL
jgi:UDP-N-acetylmuramoyl-tripeptide--D-alanyl-D-alanine ligase